MARDPSLVAAAVAAVEQPPAPERATVKVVLAPGREVFVNAPVDLTPIELIALIGQATTADFVRTLQRSAKPLGRQIFVPDRLARG